MYHISCQVMISLDQRKNCENTWKASSLNMNVELLSEHQITVKKRKQFHSWEQQMFQKLSSKQWKSCPIMVTCSTKAMFLTMFFGFCWQVTKVVDPPNSFSKCWIPGNSIPSKLPGSWQYLKVIKTIMNV